MQRLKRPKVHQQILVTEDIKTHQNKHQARLKDRDHSPHVVRFKSLKN